MRTVDLRFDYIIILCSATMFDFADVTENRILCWNSQLTNSFASFVHWRLLFKRYIERIASTRETGITNEIICSHHMTEMVRAEKELSDWMPERSEFSYTDR